MHVKNTHFFIGMTSGKEAFRLPYNNGCTLPGRLPWPVSVHLYSTGDTRGEGSHWWNVALKTPQTTRPRVTADLKTQPAASDCSICDLMQLQRMIQETWHKVSWASWQWWQVTPSLLMDEERGKFLSVWSTCLQSQVWLSEWLGLWRADNLLIPVWVTAWLPEANQRRGELCLISGHHYKCYCHKMWSGELCHNPTSLGAVKHKMVNIERVYFFSHHSSLYPIVIVVWNINFLSLFSFRFLRTFIQFIWDGAELNILSEFLAETFTVVTLILAAVSRALGHVCNVSWTHGSHKSPFPPFPPWSAPQWPLTIPLTLDRRGLALIIPAQFVLI